MSQPPKDKHGLSGDSWERWLVSALSAQLPHQYRRSLKTSDRDSVQHSGSLAACMTVTHPSAPTPTSKAAAGWGSLAVAAAP